MDTWLTRTLGVGVPVVQAPMAGVSQGTMAAAVSQAGALGMLGVGPTASADWITEQASVAARPGKPYGIGLMAWALADNPDQVRAAAESSATLVSVSFGPFERPAQLLKQAGKLVTTQVGNLDEARRAERAGVDLIVARGAEGGGHGRNDMATLPLLQAVLDTVAVPVLAAGGIATSRGLAAVLAAGAAGAWAGTAFLACRESAFFPAARPRLIDAGDTATVYGRVFDVAQRSAWPPEYGGRALRNRFFEEWHHREDELADDDTALAWYAQAQRDGDLDTAAVYAGQGVTLLRSESTAADVVAGFANAPDPVG
jgi:nitronate monooxygenase